MSLNNNGQAITLSNQLKEKGAVDGASLPNWLPRKKKSIPLPRLSRPGRMRCGCTTGWPLRALTRMKDVKTITVPPPQMVANMRVGNMDGFCVGEPWNNRAIMDNIGFTATTTQDIWTDHPEKVLGTTAEFCQKYPNTARAMILPFLMPASGLMPRLVTSKTAETIAQKAYVNTDTEVIVAMYVGSLPEWPGQELG